MNIPWLVMGYINQSIDMDKHGPLNQNMANKLRDTLDGCEFVDFGFNGRKGVALIKERLDRA